MPTLVEYICQRCGTRSEVRAALRPSALLECPECEGHRQAVRLISGRYAGEALVKATEPT